MLSENFIRWGGLAALVGAVIGILYFPFHATAYFATQDGASSLDAPQVAAWAEPFARLFDPLLTFAHPGQVYITFGKFVLLVLLGYLAGVLALHSRQGAHAGRLKKWGFRVLLVGTVLGTVGAFGEYYTPHLYIFFVAFAPRISLDDVRLAAFRDRHVASEDDAAAGRVVAHHWGISGHRSDDRVGGASERRVAAARLRLGVGLRPLEAKGRAS